MACGTFAQLPACTTPEVAFAGRSNVGKSSLLNKLLNRKSLARVSAKPGKTITINFYALDGVRLTDLPGYGYAKVAQSEKKRWAEMMEGYFGSRRTIRLVVQLIDMRHPPSADDLAMLDYLVQMQVSFRHCPDQMRQAQQSGARCTHTGADAGARRNIRRF